MQQIRPTADAANTMTGAAATTAAALRDCGLDLPKLKQLMLLKEMEMGEEAAAYTQPNTPTEFISILGFLSAYAVR